MTMVGRDGEQTQLSAFVQASEGECLALTGEPGVGKTTLLNYAAGRAAQAGHLVIRATGVETESGLPYAGLHQLLHPLICDASQPATDIGAEFDTVFGQTEGTPPSAMTLGLAVLRLLSSAASKRPLLLVLDDAHWLDDASAAVCGFVARRLSGTPMKLLVAERSDVAARFPAVAPRQTPVTPLAADDAALLLDRYRPALSKQVRRLVLSQAQGNPLALLELPAHLAGHDGDRLPEELLGRPGEPLPTRLQHIYGTRIAALADSVRAELLKGALDGAGAGPGYGVPPSPRYRMHDVEEAVACGLLVDEPATGELAFRHPLVRTSVVRSATPNQRHAAHQALARTHREDLDRRAAHLAAATVDPDEEVAAVLEAAAESATRRGAALTAATWLTRAAELSGHRADRLRRLDDAAVVAGHVARLGQEHRFVQTGLATGADRARDELRATGTRPRASVRAPLALTPQEREIAALAASGMTNEEIAARTRLSPRTVSTRLYRIFPVLGVTSRSALRDALARLDGVSPAVIR